MPYCRQVCVCSTKQLVTIVHDKRVLIDVHVSHAVVYASYMMISKCLPIIIKQNLFEYDERYL